MSKSTRTRIPKPSWSWSGMTALTWRSEPASVEWAQRDPRFRELTTLMLNERIQATAFAAMSESRALGRLEGYQIALDVLASLTSIYKPASAHNPEPTYPANRDEVFESPQD